MNNHKLRKCAMKAGSAFNALALLGAGLTATAVLPTAVAAQDVTTGVLSAQVIDSSMNPVPGAEVSIVSNSGTSRSTTTSSTGTFTVTQLPVGSYTVTITAPGYAVTQIENVQVNLGGNSYSFEVAAESGGEIVVTASPIRNIDFSGAATGAVFDVQETANRIPVPRTLEAVALLAPQAVEGDSAFGSNVALAGSSVAENIYYVNGLNITNFRTFVGGSTVPFEFYDQIQVKTGGYQAEFGRSTGGAVIAVTRSGSNEWHGGMNVSARFDALSSKQPNTYIADNEKDYYQQIEGNVYLSGPIVKDHLFVFGFVNPRFETLKAQTRADVGNATYQADVLKSDTPFYGGKVDFVPFDGHRFEFTYFNDSNTDVTTTESRLSADNSVSSSGVSQELTGGENMVGKYTGNITDWLTVSALYGQTKYTRITGSTLDANPAVYDATSGSFIYLGGSPAFVIEQGKDKREFYRADVDIYAEFLGTHQIRFGIDHEELFAENLLQYSGGEYWAYFQAGPTGAFNGAVGPNEVYTRQRIYRSGGNFTSENTAFYIQDNWDVTDRLQLSLGLRNDRFRNFSADGSTFVDIKNQWAPRLGATYDVFGDRRTKLSAFFGRYYLPVAANTNIRLAGQELYTQQYFTFSGRDPNTFVPQNTTPIGAVTVFSDTDSPDPAFIVSKNLKPQYLDEFIVGAEHRFDSGWKFGLTGTYRELKNVLEDADFGHRAIPLYCAQASDPCNGEETLSVGSGGYVLYNPGEDVIFDIEAQGNFAGGEVTLTPDLYDFPDAKRKYYGVEFRFEREYDGVWGLQGSYTWSKSKGNYEGGVKSDNGQDDTGLTQDFDEPGWMDGSYGYLPNDRRHQFKVFGTYSPLEWLQLGMNARVISPRKFGCIGIYPFDDGVTVTPPGGSSYYAGRAQDPFATGGNDSWYCGDRSNAVDSDGNGDLDTAIGTVLVGRGGGFKGDWEKRIDLSLAIKPKVEQFRNVTFRVDVFNVFNFDGGVDFREIGDEDSVLTDLGDGTFSVPLDEDYGKITRYQTARYVRLGISLDF